MTTDEKNVQIALGTYLHEAWKKNCKLIAEGDILNATGWKCIAEGRKLWEDAVVEVYGKNIIKWVSYHVCTVDGREFRYDYS